MEYPTGSADRAYVRIGCLADRASALYWQGDLDMPYVETLRYEHDRRIMSCGCIVIDSLDSGSVSAWTFCRAHRYLGDRDTFMSHGMCQCPMCNTWYDSPRTTARIYDRVYRARQYTMSTRHVMHNRIMRGDNPLNLYHRCYCAVCLILTNRAIDEACSCDDDVCPTCSTYDRAHPATCSCWDCEHGSNCDCDQCRPDYYDDDDDYDDDETLYGSGSSIDLPDEVTITVKRSLFKSITDTLINR